MIQVRWTYSPLRGRSNQVGVYRLLRLLTLSPDCHSAQDLLLQLAAGRPGPATPSSSWRLPCFRRTCPGFPSWRSPSRVWLVGGDRPRCNFGSGVAYSMWHSASYVSPHHSPSCLSSLLVIPRGRLSWLITSRETRYGCRLYLVSS